MTNVTKLHTQRVVFSLNLRRLVPLSVCLLQVLLSVDSN